MLTQSFQNSSDRIHAEVRSVYRRVRPNAKRDLSIARSSDDSWFQLFIYTQLKLKKIGKIKVTIIIHAM
jgi:hypothetical protein